MTTKKWPLFLFSGALFLFSGCTFKLNVPDVGQQVVTAAIDEGAVGPAIDYADPVLNDRKIFLTGNLNFLNAQRVVEKLHYLNNKDPQRPIDLFINCRGGNGFAAMSIIETMQYIEAPVNTWVMDFAASNGALILATGTGRRYATFHSVVWVHGGRLGGGDVPGATELKLLWDKSYENLFQKCTRLPAVWYPLDPEENHVLSAEEALEYGLIDEIKEPFHPLPKD